MWYWGRLLACSWMGQVPSGVPWGSGLSSFRLARGTSNWFICAARRSGSAVSFFSQYAWDRSGPGAVQLFIPETFSWMSATMMLTGRVLNIPSIPSGNNFFHYCILNIKNTSITWNFKPLVDFFGMLHSFVIIIFEEHSEYNTFYFKTDKKNPPTLSVSNIIVK